MDWKYLGFVLITWLFWMCVAYWLFGDRLRRLILRSSLKNVRAQTLEALHGTDLPVEQIVMIDNQMKLTVDLLSNMSFSSLVNRVAAGEHRRTSPEALFQLLHPMATIWLSRMICRTILSLAFGTPIGMAMVVTIVLLVGVDKIGSAVGMISTAIAEQPWAIPGGSAPASATP